MKGLDLFSGIGLFSLGMEEAGIETVAACELADWKRLIFAELCGEMPMWHDIKDMRGSDVLGRAGPIDIVFGSPPCRDASAANVKGRQGIDGRETGLFLEAIRIIREIRPDWVALENVLGFKSRGADRIITELEKANYATWPLLVGTKGLGASDDRRRVFFIGCNRARMENSYTDSQGQQRLSVNEQVARQPCQSTAKDSGRVPRNAIHDWSGGLGRYLQLAHGCPAKTAKMLMSACGDGVVVEVAAAIGRAIMQTDRDLTAC